MTEERESQDLQSQEVSATGGPEPQAEVAEPENAPVADDHARDLRLQQLQAALEAVIYAADEPASIDQLSRALDAPKPEVRAALDLLTAAYSTDSRGIEVRKVAGGWKFYTKPQHHDVVRRFIKSLQPPIRLTMPALETLAVIAYKQPATVPEINEIRGVNVGGVIKTLLEKHLITTAGRKEVIGRPILYRTSKQFLMRFGLSDLDELPSLKEFEQLAQAALGSDAGVAPVEPEVSGETPGEAEGGADPSTDASSSEGLDVAPGFSPAPRTSVAADARERAIESASDDASGEQSAGAETATSPAQSAAETFADASEHSRAAKAGSTSSEPSS
jgi:segregation and condensation protein B